MSQSHYNAIIVEPSLCKTVCIVDFAVWICWMWRPVLNGDPVLSHLDSSDRLIIVLEVIVKVDDMTEMSKSLTTTNFN